MFWRIPKYKCVTSPLMRLVTTRRQEIERISHSIRCWEKPTNVIDRMIWDGRVSLNRWISLFVSIVFVCCWFCLFPSSIHICRCPIIHQQLLTTPKDAAGLCSRTLRWQVDSEESTYRLSQLGTPMSISPALEICTRIKRWDCIGNYNRYCTYMLLQWNSLNYRFIYRLPPLSIISLSASCG